MDKNEQKLKYFKYKKDLVDSEQWKQIRAEQLNKIVELSTSNIDEKELKGMLKLIAKTDNWSNKYDTYVNNKGAKYD